MFGNSLVVAQLAASQEGLSSIELVSYVISNCEGYSQTKSSTCPIFSLLFAFGSSIKAGEVREEHEP
jgi:hypothetical protein